VGQAAAPVARGDGAPLRAKRICARRILGARRLADGINGPVPDRSLIRARALKTARAGGWLVFHAQGVEARPGQFGMTPRKREAGCAIRPVAEAPAA